ncbi:MAG: sigma-70 family RNA polymerase sigma factor [Clostridium sp.]|uniref:RNA polymerase sigma factor n=1 Tax=Clostridium sp. TaxID=1506 RepID=UPI0025C05371|nr:sigma-70 family RNA polymerase sigma factor [Clostridium sp.]MCF0148590.1 sigma-70 family RNA polymerase sigma factor [Clostridium sp.]
MNNYEIEELYNKYYKDLYIYAFSICKNYHITEEVVSETFLRAFITIDNAKCNVKFWLLYVCKNIIIDYYRKNKRMSYLDIEEKDIRVEDNTLEKFIKDEEKREVFKSILKLSEVYREVIIKFYYMNLTTKEIAKSLQVSEGAVRSILYRGRQKIGKLLRKGKYEF